MWLGVLQCVAVCCSVRSLAWNAAEVLYNVAKVCCNTVCCSVLQCVAVCCSVC